MTDEQRLRHTAKPGLSGLAQVNGRNAISWEDKLEWDLKYIRNISLKRPWILPYMCRESTSTLQEVWQWFHCSCSDIT